MTDESIVELYWSRSQDAITETAAKYQKYCTAIAYNILRNTEDADECVNDAYLKTWNAIPTARPNRLSTFLGKITRNLSFDRYKLKHTDKRGGGNVDIALSELEECVPSDSTVEQAVDENILTEAINTFLTRLSKLHRTIFMRRYWYLSPISEIAAEYGMSEGNIKTVLCRTRNKLKIHLQGEGIL